MKYEEFLDGRMTPRCGGNAQSDPRRALEIGKAAEHLVVADLILSGHRAFLTDQGLPYDVVFDHNGRLFRVQVKSTTKPRAVPDRPGSAPAYFFNVRRSGKGAARIIGNDEFDLLALVALDIREVAYLKMGVKVLQTIHISAPGSSKTHANRTRDNFDEYPLSRVLKELGQ
jgi:hypothetical protein